MEITLGQQYNVGEKPTVILYTYINHHAGTPEKTVKTKQRQCSTPSHMVVIICSYMGYKYKATTWYLTGFPNVMVVTLGQQYNVGEKRTVILYTYITGGANRKNLMTECLLQPDEKCLEITREKMGINGGYNNCVLKDTSREKYRK